ncbi:MAG: hypothetical protein ABI870_10835 [Rhodanobacter sp.]
MILPLSAGLPCVVHDGLSAVPASVPARQPEQVAARSRPLAPQGTQGAQAVLLPGCRLQAWAKKPVPDWE